MEDCTKDIKCRIDWKESKTEMDKVFKKLGAYDEVFDAEIRYNYRNSGIIEFLIFYPPGNHLFEQLEYLKDLGKNILQYIQIENDKLHNEFLDFSKTDLMEMREGHREWKYSKKPVIFKLKNLIYYDSSSYTPDGLFYLTENACLQIHQCSNYNVDYENIHISDKPINNGIFTDYTNWGNMDFAIGFIHWIKETDKYNIIIERLPYIQVKAKEKDTDLQIMDYASDICLLMSLFWNKQIDYNYAKVRSDRNSDGERLRTRFEHRFIENQIDDKIHLSWKDNYKSLFDFVNDVDYGKFMICKKVLKDITDRIIRSQYVDTSSEFMLLYNVIEKIRNHYLDLGKEGNGFSIKEEFEFNLPAKKRDKHIKHVLKGIIPIVKSCDKLFYQSMVGDKVTFIRKTGLKDQFESLVEYLKLSPADYRINFTDLIKIRNKLYHGSLVENDLRPFIIGMRRLINDLILKLLCYE